MLTLVFATPFLLARSSMPAWQALLLGFIAFNVVAVGLLFGVGWIIAAGGSRACLFLVKTFILVFVFVWMRGTLPACPHRPADGLRLEVAAAGALLNLFVTAAAISSSSR